MLAKTACRNSTRDYFILIFILCPLRAFFSSLFSLLKESAISNIELPLV